MDEAIASPAPSYRADLQTWFDSLSGQQYAYALIDLANLKVEAAKALKCIQAVHGQSILNDSREDAMLASPWLVHLTSDEVGQDMFRRTLVWASQSACVTWLQSHLPLADLAQRLHDRTKAELPDAHAVLLRFFDPRVLPQLHRVLEADQASTFWALGQAWRHVSRDQRVQCFALANAPDLDAFAPPLKLNSSQFNALMSASELDIVMPGVAREEPEAFRNIPPNQRAAFTQRCLKLADTWHVEALPQRVMVAVLALKLGEDFHQQAAWAPWIAKLSQGKITLIQAIEGATAP